MAITNPQDSFVQVAVDGAGKKIDNAGLLRDGDTVSTYRQRVVLSSDTNPLLQVQVEGESGKAYAMVDSRSFDEVVEVLSEIRDLLRLTIDR